MKALVTGGAGFIGSALARRLLEDDVETRVLDNFSTGYPDNVPPSAELFEGELGDEELLKRACAGVDVVFHQAALGSVPRSMETPLATHDSNVTGTLKLLIAATDAGVSRLIYASSSSVYGNTGEGLNHESATPNPLSPYAVSKLAAEYYCRTWSKTGLLETVCLRYFNVFGPGQDPNSRYAAVFPRFISALAAGEAPEVQWDGQQSRDFSFIDDVVHANVLAARAGSKAAGEVFNIAGGRSRTINEVLRAISDVVGRWIDPVHHPKRLGDVRASRGDISAARDVLGWEPKSEWQPAVEVTVQSLLQESHDT